MNWYSGYELGIAMLSFLTLCLLITLVEWIREWIRRK